MRHFIAISIFKQPAIRKLKTRSSREHKLHREKKSDERNRASGDSKTKHVEERSRRARKHHKMGTKEASASESSTFQKDIDDTADNGMEKSVSSKYAGFGSEPYDTT